MGVSVSVRKGTDVVWGSPLLLLCSPFFSPGCAVLARPPPLPLLGCLGFFMFARLALVFAVVSSFVAVLVLSLGVRGPLVSWRARSVSAWGGSVRPLCWSPGFSFLSGSWVPVVGPRELWSLVLRG